MSGYNLREPKTLFLTDSIGAFLTAIMLGLILPIYQEHIGMPQFAMRTLAAIASIYCLFSFYHFINFPAKWKIPMRLIALANLIYCCLTIGAIMYFLPQMQLLGLVYFFAEIAVIVFLAFRQLLSINHSV